MQRSVISGQWSRVRGWVGRVLGFWSAEPARRPGRRAGVNSARRLAALRRAEGGSQRSRLSVDSASEPTFGLSRFIEAPPSPEETWRSGTLDDQTLSRMSPTRLMELMADVSPELSRALWDFLRFCNPGWEAMALRPGTEEPDRRGQAALDSMLATLKGYYGTVDVPIGRLFLGAFLRGAFMAELVLDESGRNFVDLAMPDPASARFEKQDDPVRGKIWRLGQWQAGEFVLLDSDTVRYIPLDPLPGKPYGRPIATPAMFSTLFLIGLLHDLRRVVAQQGYPRIDLVVNLEQLMQAMLVDEGGEPPDPDEFSEYVSAAISEIQSVYASLQPDDAYIHTDVVTVNRPVGSVDQSSLGAIDSLIRAIERIATRALKTMPLLMGSNEAVSETHANRQWEIHVAGISSVQHSCEALLESLLGLALQAQGIQAAVKFRFAELRASERLRDAQAESAEIDNEIKKYLAGWISQDAAAQAITGQEADQPEPRGSESAAGGTMRRRGNWSGNRAVQIVPNGSEAPLPPVPDAVEIGNDEAEAVGAIWDRLLPEYAGLWDASVSGRTEFDEEFSESAGSDWEWNQRSKTYRNTETGYRLTQRRLLALRDELTAKLLADNERAMGLIAARGVDELADGLVDGSMTVQRWLLDMRDAVKNGFLSQYMLAKGGKNNMTFADYGRIGRMLAPDGQYRYLQGFAEQIAAGELSAAQIRARSRLYINATVQAYERGKAAAYGMPNLPEYPADGSQQCRANCRCSWSIAEFDDRWECTWVVDTAAESCEDCVENGRRWAPLVINKDQARTRPELEQVLAEKAGRNHHAH